MLFFRSPRRAELNLSEKERYLTIAEVYNTVLLQIEREREREREIFDNRGGGRLKYRKRKL